MRFFCEQEIMAQALQIVSRAVSTRATLPILNGIYVKYENNNLLLRATDLEINIELMLENIEGDEEGAVVFSGKRFVDIVRYLPKEKITIFTSPEENQVSIETRHSSFQLPVLPPHEFPSLPEVEKEFSFRLSFDELRDGIRKTSYATLSEDIRPFLTAVLFEFAGEKLKLVATDINRLAFFALSLPQVNYENKVLIPTRTLQEIARLPFENEDEIEIVIGSRQIRFSGKNLIVTSRLVEAQFPDYEKVIPRKFKTTIHVNRELLLKALERASIMISSVKVNVDEGKMTIMANEPETGKAYEEILLEKQEGEKIVIGFNARFLIDFLNAVDMEEIVISFSGEEKPVIMEGKGEENYLYVVMPMKLN